MQVLVLSDDFYHPARVAREGLAPLGEAEWQFDWIEDAREWSAARMQGYPLVVLVKSNAISAADRTAWMTPEAERAFEAYVQQGGGLLAIHSGTAGYQETPTLRRVLGGVFLKHPAQCDVTIIPHAGHPLSAGSAPYTVKDEHYHMALDDAQADVFLTCTSVHGSQPGGWTRQEGQGRVGVLTPGHNVEVWVHPAFQTLLRNTLRWCVGK
jgi:type 1 glutamine amidotransferase